ncbi:hypothetical protein CMALT430_40087 [Carnobacterium maltaromaticum]|nr:class III lanthipeptide [Carnobacterium maltaromaticum]CAD5901007.1 hypothetical protein CMALT430_40085 [Carnobacterium maltaromaticum]CAD5901008.1 hypothetical protein CMALT430_40086 [Carnobacterium maltaromaticum]CAD5901009.1 hypothetical protein CMALT430_40087 [Carnobacterium maltaromaticum]
MQKVLKLQAFANSEGVSLMAASSKSVNCKQKSSASWFAC